VLIAALFLFPFAFVNKIERLRFLAFFGITGITCFLLTFIIVFFKLAIQQNWNRSGTFEAFGNDGLQIGIVLPNLIFALAFQMNFFPIFKGKLIIIKV
jgi:amino acid permease